MESRMFAEVVAGGGVGRVGALGSRMDVEEVVRKRAREARLQHSSHPLQLPRASGDGHNEAALVSSSNLHSKKRARTLDPCRSFGRVRSQPRLPARTSNDGPATLDSGGIADIRSGI